MLLYHTYDSRKGEFNLNRIDFNRGIFCIKPWWVGDKKYDKYSAFSPNEFGDKVVEIDINDGAKVYRSSDQIEILKELFPNSSRTKTIIDKNDNDGFDRTDWHKLDTLIGKKLKKQGYQLIHYTEDPMYGDTWAIISKDIIKGVKHG